MWICVRFEPGPSGSWLRLNALLASSFVGPRTSDGSWSCTFDINPDFLMLGYGPTVNLLLFLTQIIHNSSMCIAYVCVFTWIFKGRLYIYLDKRSGPGLIQIFLKLLCPCSQPQSLNPHYWLYAFAVLAVLIIDNVALLKCCSLLT